MTEPSVTEDNEAMFRAWERFAAHVAQAKLGSGTVPVSAAAEAAEAMHKLLSSRDALQRRLDALSTVADQFDGYDDDVIARVEITVRELRLIRGVRPREDSRSSPAGRQPRRAANLNRRRRGCRTVTKNAGDALAAKLDAVQRELVQSEHDRTQANEALLAARAGQPLGPVIGSQTIINQQREMESLRKALAESQRRERERVRAKVPNLSALLVRANAYNPNELAGRLVHELAAALHALAGEG